MGSDTAEGLRARLALRALWSVRDLRGRGADEDEDEDGGEASFGGSSSSFRRALREEMDTVMKDGLNRRKERVKKQVDLVVNGMAAPAAGGSPAASGGKNGKSQAVSTELLTQAAVQAMRAAILAAEPSPKVYGPSRRQDGYEDPPEKEEEIPMETTTLQYSLECLQRNIGSRQRQIQNLRRQFDVVQQECDERAAARAESEAKFKSLSSGSSDLLQATHKEHLQHLRHTVKEVQAEGEQKVAQAIRFKKLAKDQTRYLLQSKHIAMGGADLVHGRNPAGDLAVAFMPPPLSDENMDRFDIGTAVANPYVVDSWPFEPNVLASRCHHELLMEPYQEESKRDIEDEMMRRPVRGTGFALYNDEDEGDFDEDEDDDDRGGRPPGTARSQ